MRVRLTIEYDTDETLAYELAAWTTGDVGFPDFLALAHPDGDQSADPTITITFEPGA